MSDLKKQTKKGLYWQSINQFAHLGLQFLIGLVLARLLSPEDYGITALPNVFIGIANVFIDCGFGQALVRKPVVTEKDLSTAFYYSISLGIILYCSLFFSAGFIAGFYNAPVLKPVLRVTAIGLLLGPVSSVQGVQLTRAMDFKTKTKISLICKISTGAFGLTMALLGCGIWSLVIPQIVSQLLNVVLLYAYVRWLPSERWSKDSFKYLWGFGSKLMFSYLIGTIYEGIYPIIIGKYYSPAQLGVWNRAQGYAALPSKQATNVLQSVTFPALSKMQDNDERLATNYRRIIKVSAFVVFPIMVMLSALAYPLIVALITDKWVSCVPFLKIMSFAMMLYPIHAVNLNLLQVMGRSDYFLKLEIIKKLLGLLILCVTMPFGLKAMAYGMLVNSVLCLFINTYYTGKLIRVGIMRQIVDIMPSIILSALVFGAVTLCTRLISSLWLQIIIGGIVGVAVYVGASAICKRDELDDIRYMLKLRRDEKEV